MWLVGGVWGDLGNPGGLKKKTNDGTGAGT